MSELTPAAQAMFDKVCSYGSVSMVELERVFEAVAGEDAARGELTIEATACPKLALWASVSEGFMDAFDEIAPLVDLEPCHLLVYLMDGAVLQLPLAKRPPKNGYRKLHWAPAVLNAKPGCHRLATSDVRRSPTT
jgi:hypothetical protein